MNLLKNETAEVVAHDVTPLEVNTDARAFSRMGWLIVLLGVGGFLLWALLAPLDKGVPLSGTVAAESNRQAVQHLAGGTIQQLLVRDGDVVKQGQVLVRMNPVTAQSAVEVTETQYLTALAHVARLEAERDGKKKIVFPDELLKRRSEPRVSELMSLQEQLLLSRQGSLQNEVGGLDESIAGLKLQVAGLQESRDSKKEQVAILKEQLAGMRDLAREGYVARNRLLDLERTYAQLGGAISEDIGNIGRSQRQVTELSLRRAQRLQEYQKEVRTQLSDYRKEADAHRARLQAQRFELGNVEVRAPASGTVVNLAVFTNGGVVPPGFKLMEIVPSGAPLIVDGQLPTNLVDKVRPGLPVELIFSAFNTNKTPHIEGELTHVSADRSVDERTGFPYYKVHVKVTPEGARKIAQHKMDIRPGMPVELFVKTGERTMMNYLLKPIVDRAHSALSED
ncbi:MULTISPECIES: HlyD family type I secretion periplasmic adaptor subunit [unclassified Massilia]|uniref:HlyD family type I secretion periplasmic adaptor subunit n=1 Tax=unclassified Massilia TaxID=2609279 RepID=UPI001B81D9A6|nr:MULTISPECIES: HlyD family type I secretion periplasmic adaptor subunit [unclassified Massilia]MBQ5940442.1 HlyD family type I secretion periplasmic adaptor subunit [Massilia sp. AB1]MBQ5963587.1 HlyD family type I secretion periplasmic adaptor subunit [Massilia sp. ZL223]